MLVVENLADIPVALGHLLHPDTGRNENHMDPEQKYNLCFHYFTINQSTDGNF